VTGMLSVLLLAVPAALLIWFMLGRPLGVPPEPRRGTRSTRIYQVSRAGGRRRPAVDRAVAMAGGPGMAVTVETVGAVTPEPPRPRNDEALPPAVAAMGESNAMAAAEQTPAFLAAAATPAAASAAGTPLAEELPDPELVDRLGE
jgi:hypothetical protein